MAAPEPRALPSLSRAVLARPVQAVFQRAVATHTEMHPSARGSTLHKRVEFKLITTPLSVAVQEGQEPQAKDQPTLLPFSREPPKLKISSWAIWRSDFGKAGLATAGQLGGSQAGIRATLPVIGVGRSEHLGLNARASTPLRSSKGKEAAFGVVLTRPGTMPLEIGIERRLGARDAIALTVATGINDLAIAPKVTLTGYGQAGLVGLRNRDAFVDGAIQIDRTLLSGNKMRLSGGLGVWGAVQPGLKRLDIGPQASLRVSNILVSGQWRFRATGEAQPGSGPAIIIGADF